MEQQKPPPAKRRKPWVKKSNKGTTMWSSMLDDDVQSENTVVQLASTSEQTQDKVETKQVVPQPPQNQQILEEQMSKTNLQQQSPSTNAQTILTDVRSPPKQLSPAKETEKELESKTESPKPSQNNQPLMEISKMSKTNLQQQSPSTETQPIFTDVHSSPKHLSPSKETEKEVESNTELIFSTWKETEKELESKTESPKSSQNSQPLVEISKKMSMPNLEQLLAFDLPFLALARSTSDPLPKSTSTQIEEKMEEQVQVLQKEPIVEVSDMHASTSGITNSQSAISDLDENSFTLDEQKKLVDFLVDVLPTVNFLTFKSEPFWLKAVQRGVSQRPVYDVIKFVLQKILPNLKDLPSSIISKEKKALLMLAMNKHENEHKAGLDDYFKKFSANFTWSNKEKSQVQEREECLLDHQGQQSSSSYVSSTIEAGAASSGSKSSEENEVIEVFPACENGSQIVRHKNAKKAPSRRGLLDVRPRHKHTNNHKLAVLKHLGEQLHRGKIEWKGNVMWKLAERLAITNLSWQGMRSLALKIAPKLHELPNEVQQLLPADVMCVIRLYVPQVKDTFG